MSKVTYPKMNPKVKRLWLAALRSRKFKQGRGRLQPTEDTYCCLGVLHNLLGDNFYIKAELDNKAKTQLIKLNDGYIHIKPHKFYQIARWIERNL